MLHAKLVIPDQSSASLYPICLQAVVEIPGQPPQTEKCLFVHTTREKDTFINPPLFSYLAFADLDVVISCFTLWLATVPHLV